MHSDYFNKSFTPSQYKATQKVQFKKCKKVHNTPCKTVHPVQGIIFEPSTPSTWTDYHNCKAVFTKHQGSSVITLLPTHLLILLRRRRKNKTTQRNVNVNINQFVSCDPSFLCLKLYTCTMVSGQN